MQSYYLRCPVCESMNHQKFATWFHVFPTPRPASSIKGDVPLQTIVICRDCGMVFRNPYIPDLCPVYYIWDSPDQALKRVNPTFSRRAEIVADEMSRMINFGDGDMYLDIGCGPAAVPTLLAKRFPTLRTVLMEPSAYALLYAKSQIPGSEGLPSNLEEAELPEGAFSVVSALGVDYLFRDHRAAIRKISRILKDGGIFYIERFFLDQPSFYRQPILDFDDLFGLNSMMNTWFGHKQFVEYLSEFFDVFHEFTYLYDTTPAPLSRQTPFTGVFCRKRPGGAEKKTTVTNYYDEHLNLMRKRAPESSLEDLRLLAEAGVKSAIICGDGHEARVLARMIKENQLFSVEGFIGLNDQAQAKILEGEFKSPGSNGDVNAFLIASSARQEDYVKLLERNGYSGNLVFRCFRPDQPQFFSDGNTNVQLKAFLPLTMRQLGSASLYTR